MSKKADEPSECPCCAAGAVVVTQHSGKNFWKGYVKCNRKSCGIRTPTFKSRQHAINVWNREPDD